MKGIDVLKGWVGALTELALMLLALAIVLALLVGSQLPFSGLRLSPGWHPAEFPGCWTSG